MPVLARLLGFVALCVAMLSSRDGLAEVLVAGEAAPTLQATIDAAGPDDVVEVPEGVWDGPITVGEPITLRGRGGIIDGKGKGTVVRVTAPGAVLEKLTIRGSGDDLGAPDSCIYVTKEATGMRIVGSELSHCAFGIWIHETEKAEIVGNVVTGTLEGHRSNRGNGIHLFNASKLVLKENVVTGGRDGIYVSAVEDSLIENNRFEATRYGVHYMFSYSNTLLNNHGTKNFSGFALMGSRYIKAKGNVSTHNEEHGLLLRDIENCEIRDNRLEHNGLGLFVYSSIDNQITGNLLAANEVGAKFWAGSLRNEVSYNEFVGNRTQIFYVSSQDLEWGTDGPGNYWSDYTGWDQDGDGMGDRPYRLDSFTTNLLHRYKAATLLLNSPALETLSHLEQSMPLLRVPTVIDKSPVMRRRRR